MSRKGENTIEKRSVRYICAAFSALLLVSVYRQLSLALLPGDRLRPFLVFAVYMLLMGAWIHSLHMRITQKSMRRFLMLECTVMCFWLTVRLLQDALL